MIKRMVSSAGVAAPLALMIIMMLQLPWLSMQLLAVWL
jgi:hypothetical protein